MLSVLAPRKAGLDVSFGGISNYKHEPTLPLVVGKPWRGIPEFRVMGVAHSDLKAQPRHGKI